MKTEPSAPEERIQQLFEALTPYRGKACNAPYSKKNVCIVRRATQPHGWSNGNWLYLETWCGRHLKHDPHQRNCIVNEQPTCLVCLSESQ